MYKNIFLSIFAICSMSFYVNADDHSSDIKSDGTIGEFNYFSVTDPVEFVSALTSFSDTKCANKWREASNGSYSLWSLRGSSYSHFVLVSYESWDAMDKGSKVLSSCPAFANMVKSFDDSTNSERSWNWVTENALSGRTWQDNTVFSKFNFDVKEGMAGDYAAAWKKMMSAQMDNVPGSFGINTVVYGNGYASHMVYLGANSTEELTSSFKKVTSTDDFKEFVSTVKDIRSNINTEMVTLVKAF